MLQKNTLIFITDNTNVRWVKIFHLYKGFFRKKTKEGFFIKGSSKVVEPPRLEYKGFKYKYKLKGDIVRAWIVRTRVLSKSLDKRMSVFNDNSGLVINKKSNITSKFLSGPISRTLKRKKILTLFKVSV